MKKLSDEELISIVNQRLDKSIENMDVNLLRQLSLSRESVLKKPQSTGDFLTPFFSLAMASMLIVTIFILPAAPNNSSPKRQLDKLEIISGHDELNFYNDLDFYQWLENENQTG